MSTSENEREGAIPSLYEPLYDYDNKLYSGLLEED